MPSFDAYPSALSCNQATAMRLFPDPAQAARFLEAWEGAEFNTLAETVSEALGVNVSDVQQTMLDDADTLLVHAFAGRAYHPTECENCNTVYNRRAFTLYRSSTGDYVCDDCLGDYFYADDTGEYHPTSDNLYYHESDDVWRTYPEDEADDYDSEDDSGLLSYGTNVLDVHGWPHQTDPGALCFGVELECEPREGMTQRKLIAALGGKRGNGTYILKSDGSLDYGAELVTLPYTLEHHRAKFGWSRILDSEVARVGKSGAGTNNCGIHVHVNRRALSPLTIGKVLVFLNSSDNTGLVETIAQRRSNGYAARDASKKITDIHGGSRYDLLNVSGGQTVEFRLFRGNLRPERVLKNLEFCHAIIRFCEGNGIKASASGSKFLTWLEARGAQYPHLVAFLREKGRMPAKPEAAAPVAAVSDI